MQEQDLGLKRCNRRLRVTGRSCAQQQLPAGVDFHVFYVSAAEREVPSIIGRVAAEGQVESAANFCVVRM